jgi:hypothetical protein
VAEKPLEDIVRYTGAGVAEVGVTVYGRTADIHSDMSGVDRFEQFFLVRKGIDEK